MHKEPPWDIRERTFQFACDIVRFCRQLSKDPSCRQIEGFWLRLIIACGLTADPDASRLVKEAGELIGIFTATVRSARHPQSP